MATPIFYDKASNQIIDIDGWTRPKQDYQWVDGRSAKELAKLWFAGGHLACPSELDALLSSHPITSHIEIHEGNPEFVTPLPEGREGRNHDLLLRCLSGNERISVCIEAKVDEAFGNLTVGEYWSSAKSSTKPTRAAERIEALLSIVFGAAAKPNLHPWRDLRYQLLSAVAGTLLQAVADDAPVAIFVVHEFQSLSKRPDLIRTNSADYGKLVRILFSASSVTDGVLYGPITITPRRHLEHPIQLLVGKATR